MVKVKSLYIFLVSINLLVMFSYGNVPEQIARGIDVSKSAFDPTIVARISVQIISGIFLSFLTRGALNVKLPMMWRLLALYIGVACISSFLNIRFGYTSVYHSLSLGLPFLLGVYIFDHPKLANSYKTLLFPFFLVSLLVLLSAIFSVIISPREALRLDSDNRLQSIILSVGSNGLAWFAFIALTFNSIYTKGVKKRLCLSTVAISIILATQSRTALFILFIYLFISSSLVSRIFLSVTAILIVWSTGIGGDFLDFILRGSQQLNSLSGRTIMWYRAFDLWLESPWIGYGLGNGSFLTVQGTKHSQISQIHSTYIELLVSVGLIGIAAISPLIMRFFWPVPEDGSNRKILRAINLFTGFYVLKCLTSSEFVLLDFSFFMFIIILTIKIHTTRRISVDQK